MSIVEFPAKHAPNRGDLRTRLRGLVWVALVAAGVTAGVRVAVDSVSAPAAPVASKAEAPVRPQEAHQWPVAACGEYYERVKPALAQRRLEGAADALARDGGRRIEEACSRPSLSYEEARRLVLWPLWNLDVWFGTPEEEAAARQKMKDELLMMRRVRSGGDG